MAEVTDAFLAEVLGIETDERGALDENHVSLVYRKL
jgi:hypothetical protein